jgi:hypothetical protein
MRNLANMIANNRWFDPPGKVEAYCNRVGMNLANYALGMRKEQQTLQTACQPQAPISPPWSGLVAQRHLTSKAAEPAAAWAEARAGR